MSLTPKQIWQEANRRLNMLEAELPIPDTEVDALLEALPLRLPKESYAEWLKRGQNIAKVIPFKKMNFHPITEVQRLAADTRIAEDALPEISLMSNNQQFRLTVEPLPHNQFKLIVEALGLASSRYAKHLIGIAAGKSKDELIAEIRLNADGDGDTVLDDTPAHRQALLRPVIALLDEQVDA